MAPLSKTVDWHQYAEKYDMLLDYNPFYQQLREEITTMISAWPMEEGDLIADLGAGTGNYSVLLAERFPSARVLHIDNNSAMNARARQKKVAAGLGNLDFIEKGAEAVSLAPGSLRAILSVHALYTFPDPHQSLRDMYDWLEPGGIGLLVDPGRIVNVWEWQVAISAHLLKRYGLKRTLRIFQEARVVSEQNRLIRHQQRKGELWTHSPEAYRAAIQGAGFEIVESRMCFRGLSDLAVVRKPA
ncbi:MAG: methyltransferase domain-containing protein [Bacteroidota bacterium]